MWKIQVGDLQLLFEWKKCRYLDLLQLILHFLPQGGFPGYLEDLCCSWLFFLVSTFFCAVFAAIIRWWAMENVRWWCWGLVSPAGVWNLPQGTHQGTLHFVVWPAKSGQVPKRREGRKNELQFVGPPHLHGHNMPGVFWPRIFFDKEVSFCSTL